MMSSDIPKIEAAPAAMRMPRVSMMYHSGYRYRRAVEKMVSARVAPSVPGTIPRKYTVIPAYM